MKRLSICISLFLLFNLGCNGPYFKIPKEPDTSPPILTITNPADQSTISGTINVSVYAFDNDEIEKVELFINDESVLSTNEGPFEYEWVTTEYNEDEHHSIQAKAVDITGNFSETRKIQVLINNIENPDITSPSGTIINPANGQTVNDTVHWIIEASDNDSVRFVIFYINGDSIHTDSSSPYKFDWITNTITDQSYSLSAKVFDPSGNSAVIGPVTVFVDNIPAPDTTPPSGNITYPPSSSRVSGSVTIKVSAFDDTAVDYVQFIINGTEKSTVSAEPYEYIWDTTIETDQENYLISVNIADQAGNIAILSTISVFVSNTGDGIGPTINIVSPASNQVVSGEVDLIASVYDESGVNRVEFYQNGIIKGTATEEPFNHLWDTNNEIDDSDYSWYALAFDIDENSTHSESIILHVNNNDNEDPSGQIIFPYPGMIVSDTINIEIEATDNEGIQSVEISIGNDVVVTASESPYEYLWDTNEWAEDQTHIIRATITDLSGNETNLAISVFVDNQDPEDTTPPVVSILFPVSGQTVSGTVPVSAFATDNTGIDSLKIFIDDTLVLTLLEEPYSHSWDTSPLANGTEHIVRVSAIDLAGNETNAQPVSVTIQTGE